MSGDCPAGRLLSFLIYHLYTGTCLTLSLRNLTGEICCCCGFGCFFFAILVYILVKKRVVRFRGCIYVPIGVQLI